MKVDPRQLRAWRWGKEREDSPVKGRLPSGRCIQAVVALLADRIKVQSSKLRYRQLVSAGQDT
jgi:hypothetical protein